MIESVSVFMHKEKGFMVIETTKTKDAVKQILSDGWFLLALCVNKDVAMCAASGFLAIQTDHLKVTESHRENVKKYIRVVE